MIYLQNFQQNFILIMSVKLKLKCRFRKEINLPGFYNDDLYQLSSSKTFKRRVSSIKMPPSLMENYELKVSTVFQRQQKEQDEKLSKAKLQTEQLSKKQLIEKLVLQMREHLGEREKELFNEEDEQQSRKSSRNRRKSQFYEERSRMLMLEQMKERFELQERQEIARKSVISAPRLEPVSPIRLQKKRSNLEQKLYEQQMAEHSQQQELKLQRIQTNVDKELMRMGLQKAPQSYSPEIRGRNLSLTRLNNSIESSQKTQPMLYSQIYRKLQGSITNAQAIKDKQIEQVIQTCQNELQSLQKLHLDIGKKRRTSCKKFRLIQGQLESVGYYGFQKAAQKRLLQE